MTVSDFYDSTESSALASPDWSHLNVKTKSTLKLKWDEIYINDDLNASKVKEHSSEEIQALKLSFSEKVNIKEYPPAVRYRGGDREPWELVYGFGRSEALRLLNTEGWFFTHLEGSDDAIEDVQAQENEKLPKRINEERDMVHFLIQKVNHGHIEKTEKDIRRKFRLVYSFRPSVVRNRVIEKTLAALGVEQPFITYTSTPKIENWIRNHSREEYVINNDYDKDRDLYVVTMKEGYQYRVVSNAFQTYKETKKKTGVIFHCGSPTKKATLYKKRRQVLEGFNEIRGNMESCGLKIWPIEVIGALPQDRETDNIKELVKFH